MSLVAEHTEHRGPVIALASAGPYVYTGGEDRVVRVWDRRSHQILQTVKVCVIHCLHAAIVNSFQPIAPTLVMLESLYS